MNPQPDEERWQDEQARPQPVDKWGAKLQNEYGRILGRIEASMTDLRDRMDEIRTEGRGRDGKIENITDKLRESVHVAAGVAQHIESRVGVLQATTETANKRLEQASAQLDVISRRVDSLEGPVKEAIAARNRRRMRIQWFFGWASFVGIIIWAVIEPLYKALVPLVVQRFLSGLDH